MTIVTRFFPNGEFTHGVDTSHRRHRNPRPQTSAPHEMIPVGDSVCLHGGDICGRVFPNAEMMKPGQELMSAKHGDKYTYLCTDMGKHIYAIEYVGGIATIGTLWDSAIRLIAEGALVPIGSSTAANFKKKARTPKGQGGMTKYLARRIRNAGYILQQVAGKDNLSFLTLTLPDLSPNELSACASRWGEMVNKFLVWLRYRCEKLHIPFEYVYCTEVQSKRLQKRGEYALHLHILFRGREKRKKAWAITPKQARNQWTNCIKSVVGHSHFKRDALENLQRIRSNAAGYLSKYMSKGSIPLSPTNEGTVLCTPSIEWGGMARNLSQAIKRQSRTFRGDGATADFAWNFIRGLPLLVEEGFVSFYKPGFIRLSEREFGQFSPYLKVGVGRLAVPLDTGILSAIERRIVNSCKLPLTSVAQLVHPGSVYILALCG